MCKKYYPNAKYSLIEPIEKCYNELLKIKDVCVYNSLISSKIETVSFNIIDNITSHSSIVNRDWLYNKPEYNKIEGSGKP